MAMRLQVELLRPCQLGTAGLGKASPAAADMVAAAVQSLPPLPHAEGMTGWTPVHAACSR